MIRILTCFANKSLFPKYSYILNDIEKHENMRVLLLFNFFNYYEKVDEHDDDENIPKNIFLPIPINVDFAKNLQDCLINSKLKVVVFIGFHFENEPEKIFCEALPKSNNLKILILRQCIFSNSVFEAVANMPNLDLFGTSCKQNKSETIMPLLELKSKRPDLIINLEDHYLKKFG